MAEQKKWTKEEVKQQASVEATDLRYHEKSAEDSAKALEKTEQFYALHPDAEYRRLAVDVSKRLLDLHKSKVELARHAKARLEKK